MGWRSMHEVITFPTGLDLHSAELPTQALLPGDKVEFTGSVNMTVNGAARTMRLP
jgi:hypothetical protein